ncbi:hypothetical protein H5410_014862 [Solanum commersonii]|uniref:Uncharacterized protein n=1 Tax=Solanum commersonii TaxID=4109 RepID=A0A9J5ZS47_SOLCO|nr:hypothetical protein H5410_014862 [Solanum commersonii]
MARGPLGSDFLCLAMPHDAKASSRPLLWAVVKTTDLVKDTDREVVRGFGTMIGQGWAALAFGLGVAPLA